MSTDRGISRREWIVRLGLAGAAVTVLPELSRVLFFRRTLDVAPITEVEAQAQTLSAPELRTLQAICARLVPTDETGPGAAEAHAAQYIDRALGGALASSREQYSLGLAALNAYAHLKAATSGFAELPPVQQDELLTDMEQNRASGFSPNSSTFFNLVRGHTLQGMFCDPIYGGNANMVGWDLIGYPGVRLNVAASEQNMSTPAARNHKSAYDYVMFSKAGTV